MHQKFQHPCAILLIREYFQKTLDKMVNMCYNKKHTKQVGKI